MRKNCDSTLRLAQLLSVKYDRYASMSQANVFFNIFFIPCKIGAVSFPYDNTIFNDIMSVGYAERNLELMLHQEDRDILLVDGNNGLLHRLDKERRQPFCWLVEHKEPRIAQNAAANG